MCVYIYISLTKRRNETFRFTRTWWEVDSMMLSEIRQSEKDKYHPTISLICGLEETNKQREKGKDKAELLGFAATELVRNSLWETLYPQNRNNTFIFYSHWKRWPTLSSIRNYSLNY